MAFYDIILRNNPFFLKKKWLIIGGIGVVVLGIIVYIVWPGGSAYETYTAQAMTLKRTITVSGSVESPEEIDLAFKTSGRVEEIAVTTGQQVKAKDYLMKLETREAENAISQARASVSEAVARLRQLEAGITDEQRALLQSNVDSAERTLSDVRQTTVFQVRTSERAAESAKTAYDNAVKNYQEGKLLFDQVAAQSLSGGFLTAKSAVSSILSLLEQTDLIMGFTDRYKTYNDGYENLLSSLNLSYKSAAQREFSSIQGSVTTMASYENDSFSYMEKAEPLLDSAISLAENMNGVLSNTVPSIDLSQSTISGWQNTIITLKTGLISSRNSVQSALSQLKNVQTSGGTTVMGLQSSLSQLENAVSTAKSALDRANTDLALARSQATAQVTQAENNLTLAQRELANRSSPPRDVDLQIYRAAVSQAQGRLNEAIIMRDNLLLTAPVDGIIGKIAFGKGESISVGQTAISLIAGEASQVEINFPETDIVFIQEEKPLTFTFDGFTQDYVYNGTVDVIEPSPTEIQGVIYYTSYISFDPKQYPEVQPRSGMTVNVDIVADQKDAAVAVPYSAVKEDNFGNRNVAVFPAGDESRKPQLVEVSTGYEGDEYIEILSGVNVGDLVLLDVQKFQE